MKTSSRPRLAVLVFLVALAPASPSRALPSGATLDIGPSPPIIWDTTLSNSGQVVYRWGTADLATDSGLSSWSPATGDAVVAQQGQQATGAPPGVVYLNFFQNIPQTSGWFVVNDAGQVAFKSAVAGPGAGISHDGSNNAVWGPGAGGDLAMLARFGEPLPGDGSGGLVGAQPSPLPDVAANILESNLVLDDAGRTTFATRLQVGTGGTTTANDVVLYRSDGAGGGSILAREGDAAPGMAPGTTYFLGLFGPFESHAGTAFVAQTTAGSVIYGEDGAGGFTPLVAAGDAAPGTGGAVFLDLDYNDRINARGELIFHGWLQVNHEYEEGFWGPKGLIVRQGNAAAGAPGTTFNGFWEVVLGDSGIAFRGGLSGAGVNSANNTGVWHASDDGRVILLARAGDPVPGLPGVLFADANPWATNAHQDTAFIANFAVGSGGVTSANDEALFLADANGALTLVLREGDFVPGLGTLRSFGTEPRGLNDARQLLVSVTFEQSDSTDVDALALVNLPEPGTTLPLGLGCGLLGVLHRRRPRH